MIPYRDIAEQARSYSAERRGSGVLYTFQEPHRCVMPPTRLRWFERLICWLTSLEAPPSVRGKSLFVCECGKGYQYRADDDVWMDRNAADIATMLALEEPR